MTAIVAGIPAAIDATDADLPLGAHLVTPRRGYTHHGIYVGGGKVVHYAGLCHGWHCGPVEQVSLACFAQGGTVHIKPARTRYAAEEVVERARSRLGENRYQLRSNNCEHFCEWCSNGESRSEQVERIRAYPRAVMVAILVRLKRAALPLRGLTEFRPALFGFHRRGAARKNPSPNLGIPAPRRSSFADVTAEHGCTQWRSTHWTIPVLACR